MIMYLEVYCIKKKTCIEIGRGKQDIQIKDGDVLAATVVC